MSPGWNFWDIELKSQNWALEKYMEGYTRKLGLPE